MNEESMGPFIKGTPNQALITRTIILGTSLAASVLHLTFLGETKLSDPLKLLLTIPASLGAALPQPFYGHSINKNGGIKLLMLFRIASCIGAMGLTILSATTDLATLDHFDWRYVMTFGFLFLTGISIASFQQITALTHAFPKNKISDVQSKFGGIGGLGPAIVEPQYNLGTMNGIIGFTGAAGGAVIPAATAGFFKLRGENAYSDIFYCMASIIILSAGATFITDRYIRKPTWNLFRTCRQQRETTDLPEIEAPEPDTHSI